MDAPAETPEPASPDRRTAAKPESTPQSCAKDTGPSGMRLVLTSLAAFTGVVMLGGVIGLIVGRPSVDVTPSTLTAASVSVAEATAGVSTTTAPSTILVQADEPVETQVLDAVERAPIDQPQPSQPSQDVAAEVPEDRAFTEPDDNSSVSDRSLALAQPIEVDSEFLELPKAVFDRFSLRPGDSFAINIAANDKIGGILQSVELTGLGELAPGFALDADGTLSGTAIVCGDWSAQYALNSTNPAVGTSWIEITVVGCNGA